MATREKLIYSIIQFLKDELKSGNTASDAGESIEVAIQCLETAYSIDGNEEEVKKKLGQDKSLLDIFSTGSGNIVTKEASEEDKAAAEALKNEGNDLMKNEKFLNALRCYTDAIKLYPTNPVYYCNRAAAHSKMNDHEQAVSDCKLAISMDPMYGKAFGRMGLALTSLGKHDEAKTSFERALQLEPDNTSYQNNLRIAEQKLQESSSTNTQGAGGGGANPFGSMPGFDMAAMLNNPNLMNMATQMMSNPQMQQFMNNMMSGMTGDSDGGQGMGIDALLQAGQQLASQMQNQNPELIEQLRMQHQGAATQNENAEGDQPAGEGQNQPKGDDKDKKDDDPPHSYYS